MKKSILQLALAITLLNTLSAQDIGKVVIRNANNNLPKFIVSLNGVRLSNDYNSSVTFSYLDDMKYTVKVLQAGSSNVLNYALTSEPNYVSKYIINRDNYGNYSFMLESKSLLSAEQDEPVKTNTVFVPNPNAETNRTVTTVINTNVVPVTTVVAKSTTLIAIQPMNPPVTAPAVTITPMDAADFNDRLNSVKKESFDREKLAKAKQVFDEENFSTTQVRTVMKEFNFDDGKLDFAKFAYSRTLDKKNYYKVQDELGFSSYKTKLADYVKQQK